MASSIYSVPTPPGTVLKLELKARGISQKDFANAVAMQPSHLSEVIKGTRKISSQMASKFESALGITAESWIKLQAKYDYDKLEYDNCTVEEHAAEQVLLKYDDIYNVRVIYKYVGMTESSSVERLDFVKNSLRFKEPSYEAARARGFYHRSEKTGQDLRMILTWTALARFEASKKVVTETYNHSKLDLLATELRSIFHENHNTLNRVERKLSDYGIKFCIVPKLEKASIDGYSFMDNQGVPAIIVTKRFDRIDNLAFAVMHEIGHLKLHLNVDNNEKINIFSKEEEKDTKEEREANFYAANSLISDDLWDTAPAVQMNPRLIQQKYTAWAKEKHVNKWIALGRISHETGMYMFKSDNSRNIN